MKVGIQSFEAHKKKMLALAQAGQGPDLEEPKIWFASLEVFAHLLNHENQTLLKIIKDQHPQSLKELSQLSHRSPASLSRTLQNFERQGIVRLKREKKTVVPELMVSEFELI